MTESYETLRLERDENIAILTLNRPQAGNAMNLTMAQELMQAAITLDADKDSRAVLLRSEGKLFSAGGDIRAFANAGERTPQLISEETACLNAGVSRLARMDKPLVTAVQGFAAGAGFSLAMLGDLVIAGEAAQFTLAYTGIGLTPDGGASWLLPRLVGLRKAQEMILTNSRLSAAEALAHGLVTHVVADDALEATAREQTKQLAAGPTKAFASCRALLLSAFGESLETHLEREARSIVAMAGTVDGGEGIQAFLDKRQPDFRG